MPTADAAPTPSHRATDPRTARGGALLPAPRRWLPIAVVLWVLVFALGLVTRAVPGALRGQLGVDRAINAAHAPALDRLALLLDRLDHVTVVAALVVLLVVVGGFAAGWLRALGAAVVAGAGWLLCLVPKRLVHEVRPPAHALAHHLDAGRATLSYPSGHVVFAVTLSIAVLVLVRGATARTVVVVLGAVFVLVTAWARLYVGAHYATDVVGALLAGVAGAVLVLGVWDAVVPRVLGARTR